MCRLLQAGLLAWGGVHLTVTLVLRPQLEVTSEKPSSCLPSARQPSVSRLPSVARSLVRSADVCVAPTEDQALRGGADTLLSVPP